MKAVLKFGGSVIVPETVDVKFLEGLADRIKSWSKKHELAIVVGGGRISREYGMLGEKITKDENLLDQLGIFAARVNASLLIATLGKIACTEIPRSEAEFLQLVAANPGKIIVAGGFRPGQRTDAVAVEIAKTWEAELVVKCTDVDYAYDKDPDKFEDAKPMKSMDYAELKKIADQEHKANKPTIMDKVAAEILSEAGIKLAIVNGKNLDNIGKALEGKEFTGTKIGF